MSEFGLSKGKKGLKKRERYGSRRRYPGIEGCRPDNAAFRKEEAITRNANWAAVPLAEQPEALNIRFPDGANRQKERIKSKLEVAAAKKIAGGETKASSTTKKASDDSKEKSSEAPKKYMKK